MSSPLLHGTIIRRSDDAPVYTQPDIFARAYADKLKMEKEAMEKRIERQRPPSHTLAFSLGAASMIGDLFPKPREGWGGKSGMTYSIEYQWASRKGIGVGVNYYGFWSCQSDFQKKISDVAQYHFIAPEFLFRTKVGKHWLWNVSFCCGYAIYTEKITSLQRQITSGAGVELSLIGFEYMVSKKFGIGLKTSAFAFFFRETDLCPGVFIGLRASAGVSIYFNE